MIKLQPSKDDMMEAIRKEASARMGDLTVDSFAFQGDPKSLQAMQARLAVAKPGDRITWVLANNEAHEFSYDAFAHAVDLITKRNDRVHVAAAECKCYASQGVYVDPKDPKHMP